MAKSLVYYSVRKFVKTGSKHDTLIQISGSFGDKPVDLELTQSDVEELIDAFKYTLEPQPEPTEE